jgi:hypothetical protein
VKLLFDVMVYKRIFLEFVFLTLITIPSFPQVNTRNVIHHDELNGNYYFRRCSLSQQAKGECPFKRAEGRNTNDTG